METRRDVGIARPVPDSFGRVGVKRALHLDALLGVVGHELGCDQLVRSAAVLNPGRQRADRIMIRIVGDRRLALLAKGRSGPARRRNGRTPGTMNRR